MQLSHGPPRMGWSLEGLLLVTNQAFFIQGLGLHDSIDFLQATWVCLHIKRILLWREKLFLFSCSQPLRCLLQNIFIME